LKIENAKLKIINRIGLNFILFTLLKLGTKNDKSSFSILNFQFSIAFQH